jgi:hypothetical protein
MFHPLVLVLSLSAVTFTTEAVFEPSSFLPAPALLGEFDLKCSETQEVPLVDPYCLVSDFLGLTPAEILDEIAGRWKDLYNGFTSCGPCEDEASCLPDADFQYGIATIVYVSAPARFKVCFTGAKVVAGCTPCNL